jgi:glucosamine--fructose-6-phosphate aminotransferase (isomerizing)
MCGIVGYVGAQQATPIILEGLKRLEYRGYDSAGIAVVTAAGEIAIRREVGKLRCLEALIASEPLDGTIGIGHTRWATHGVPAAYNAHPHVGMNGQVVLVHNGIVENYLPLRQELEAEGIVFASETDTEVIVQLVERYLEAGSPLAIAVRQAVSHLKGAHGIVAMSAREPDQLVAARIGHAGGVTLGIGEGEMFVASDLPALLDHTQRIVFLDPGQMAVVSRSGFRVYQLNGVGLEITPKVEQVPWSPARAAKGGHKHFMKKEIHEQSSALVDTMSGRVDQERGRVVIPTLPLTPEEARGISRIFTVACGTSYYSGLAGKHMIEALARIPVEVVYGSEFRYADPIIDDTMALLAITQSGETVDTLVSMEEGRRKGARLWSIVNVIGSQAMRIADGYIGMQAGPEIGVASTKAFTISLVDQYMLGLYLGELRGTLTAEARRRGVADLVRLPGLVGQVLARDKEYRELAVKLHRYHNFLYIGRGINYAIAREGALKLKEISYIHAEGYPAGEMKHGPIALIDAQMPVVAIATRDHVYDKMLSQIEQARARGGVVIAVATEGDESIGEHADHVIYVPATPPLLAPVVNVIPLQLLAYHIATWLGLDVDQPRNLAKSVTVE